MLRSYLSSACTWQLLFLFCLSVSFSACSGEKTKTPSDNDASSTKLTRLEEPEGIVASPWMEQRKSDQLATRSQFDVFHNFGFVDRLPESGISFIHKIVDDSGKFYIPNHYDHGNGVAVADVDQDGLPDIYFTTQLGSNQLWHNLGNGQFEDWTERAGVDLADRISVSASFADIDNDGDPDLYTTSTRGGNELFENDGKGHFTNITKQAGLNYRGHSSAAVFFDYDRDGLLDLFLINVGNFTTDDVGRGGYYRGDKAAFGRHLFSEESEQSILYKNMGENRFEDVSQQMNLEDKNWTGDAHPADLNNDDWPDLYVTNMQGHDEYYENQEGKKFVRKGRDLFPATPWGAMGVGIFDQNNDGQMDIFVSDMHTDMWDRSLFKQVSVEGEKAKVPANKRFSNKYLATDGNHIWGNAFFQNNGDGTYTEISDKVGAENYWPWGLSVGDLNADGFEDVFITASMNFGFRYAVNSILLNNRGKRFLDSEFILGVEPRRDNRTAIPWFELDCDGKDQPHPLCRGHQGRVQVWGALGSRGSAIFDLDADGDLDIITNDFNSEPLVMESNLSDQKQINFLKIRLQGKESNRDGLGAKVTLKTGQRTMTQIHDGQSGYLAQSSLPIYFGLEDAKKVDQIEIQWPSGKKQVISGPLKANQLLVIEEE